MKTLNHKERTITKFKFIAMYAVTIALLVIILSSFWSPATMVKTVVVNKQLPQQVKTIYVQPKQVAKQNNFAEDSLQMLLSSYEKKIASLNSSILLQKNTISQLQAQERNTKPKDQPNNNNSEQVTKLNKQIEFLDWALRSQVAVTNTLTKENNRLKANIAELNK